MESIRWVGRVAFPAACHRDIALLDPLALVHNVSYDSYMTEMAVSAAREHLAELIESARSSGEPVYVTRRGRRVAVILDPDQYERIIDELEDTVDRAELRASRQEDDYVPWEEVKAELGLT